MVICLILRACSGGLYFFTENQHPYAKDADSHFLGLSQNRFVNNIANLTGGAIFTNSPNALGVCFNCSTLRVESTPTPWDPLKRVTDIKKELTKGVLENIDVCDICWTGNVADRQESGGNVATTATTMRLCNAGTDECVVGDGLSLLLNHTSGEDLEKINITLLDAFNKPALGQPRMRLDIRANVANVSLTGQLSSDFDHVTSLTDVRVRGPLNSRFNLTLSFVPNILKNINIEVEIRDCMAGEIKDADAEGCTNCGPGLYSFHPDQPCMPCPENAKCSPSTITPEDGFWHSTSKSTQVHECIVDVACSKVNRVNDLEEAAMEAHRNGSVLFYDNPRYKQCADVSVQLK